jgi:hypothetical protein
MSRHQVVDLQAALRQIESWHNDGNRMRRFPRYPARGEARLCPVAPAGAGQGTFDIVHVRDISRGGIGVLSSQPVAVGASWQLQLFSQRIALATLPAFSRYCREVSDGAWLAGLEFGIEASVLLAMGVTPAELTHADETPEHGALKGECLPPDVDSQEH